MLKRGLWIAACVFLLDQATKILMLEVVMVPPRPIDVTPFFNLVIVWNRGVSFGLLSDQGWGPWPLVALTGAIVAGLLVWLARTKERWLGLALGLVIGGAVGNVVDRMIFGAVFDFIDVHAAGYHWPAFNVADAAISLGVVAIVADSLFSRRG